ncbi:LysR family transcriptional regulator substrate-binding protein [Nocardioides sp. TF02-7]|uniref:LysR family transcriptional regulator substrate-binding protein n=1 Tax=Nocardioides sp. TF02-7 TaxID=2917724 RepID=UPI001F057C91|nr:LysR family transcriptional regulator substrate-binding protein [Nocardioides sp. TF02-7]UMG92479.1 LysR family transcriptional regulator substrate-binding protein [Nocardioides sp. TF02-7]
MDRLRVAFVPGVTPDKWARVWRERHPGIRLELRPVEEADQRAVLDAGAADLTLARLPVDRERPTPLHCVVLYDERPVVVASREHFVAAADEVTTADLAEEQLALPERSGWRPAPQLDFPPMTEREAVEVAASGTAVVVLPMSLARLHHRKDVVQVPVTDLPPTQVALVWRVDDDGPVHQDFVGVTRGRRAGSGRGRG